MASTLRFIVLLLFPRRGGASSLWDKEAMGRVGRDCISVLLVGAKCAPLLSIEH